MIETKRCSSECYLTQHSVEIEVTSSDIDELENEED